MKVVQRHLGSYLNITDLSFHQGFAFIFFQEIKDLVSNNKENIMLMTEKPRKFLWNHILQPVISLLVGQQEICIIEILLSVFKPIAGLEISYLSSSKKGLERHRG